MKNGNVIKAEFVAQLLDLDDDEMGELCDRMTGDDGYMMAANAGPEFCEAVEATLAIRLITPVLLKEAA